MLEPIDVIGQVFCVQPRVVVLQGFVVPELADDAAAEELCAFLIGPIRVRVVAEEVRLHLRVKIGDDLLRLLELLHPIVVLRQAVRMLIEEGSVLHVLVVEQASILQVFAQCSNGGHRHSKNVFHFY